MTVSTSIEIGAAPEEVRATFLDFAKYPEWHTSYFKSIEPAEEGSKMAAGDTLKLAVESVKFDAVITENSASVFQWRGAPVYTIAGLRTFRFEASETTPGATTFLHSEEHSGLMSFMMSPMVAGSLIKADFDKFNQDLKARIEALSSQS